MIALLRLQPRDPGVCQSSFRVPLGRPVGGDYSVGVHVALPGLQAGSFELWQAGGTPGVERFSLRI